jgi:tetratricopeptide (TPR) repeat protein
VQRVLSRLALGRVLDPDSAQRAVAALDRRAASWSADWTSTCTATESSAPAFDRKVACLDRQLAGLKAAAQTFATADVTVARHAFDLTTGLATPTECADAAAVALPTAAQRSEVTRVDEALERAQIANLVAKPIEAAALAMPALADARRIGYPPLLVRALRTAAAVNAFGGETKLAVAQLREATNLALAAGDDYTVARALITLASDLSYTGQLDETERELELAVAALTRIDKLSAFAPTIAMIRADVAAARGQFAVALSRTEDALAAFHARGEPDALGEATVLGRHAGVLLLLDRARAAIPDYERALALTTEAVGPANPLTALAEFELASARIDADGVTTVGIAAVTHAHAILITALGADAYDTAYVGLRLAKLELELDDLAAARPLCTQLVAAFTATVGRAAGRTFDAELQLAKVDLREGRLAEAGAAVADVEARMIASRGKDYGGLADALRIEGELRIAEGQPDAALVAYEHAGVLITAAEGSESSELVLVALGRGLAELALERPDRATAELRKAERGLAGAARDTAVARLALAEALWQTGDRAGARTTALAATEGLDAIAATANPVMRARAAAWLAAH